MSKVISKIVVPDSSEQTGYALYNVKDANAIPASEKGAASGVATLDNTGKIPSSQIPSSIVSQQSDWNQTDSTAGDYIKNKPTIPAAANNGTYTVKTLVGSTTTNVSDFTANQSSADDIIFVQGSNVTITPDATNRKITIAAKDTTYSPQSLGNGIGTCSTSSGTALVVTLSGYNLVKNGFVAVTFENDVPANATLNINGKGAKPIIYKGSAIEANVIKADDTVMFCYNGSQYVVTSLGGGGAAPVNPNETVNISLTQVGGNSADLIGATVTITDDDTSDTILTTTWNGSTITTEVDVNTNYTVSVGVITGYLACADQSYQAGYQTTRNIGFQYRATGVFVEATDGKLYTSSTWQSQNQAKSVVLITNQLQRRIGLTQAHKPIYTNNNGNVENYLTAYPNNHGWDDFDGYKNTQGLLAFNIATNTNNTNYAAPYAYSYMFDNELHGYLPSSGELNIIMSNYVEVNKCLAACGGTQIPTAGDETVSTYHSSTYFGIDAAGRGTYRYCYSGCIGGGNLSNNFLILPIAKYE